MSRIPEASYIATLCMVEHGVSDKAQTALIFSFLLFVIHLCSTSVGTNSYGYEEGLLIMVIRSIAF